MNTDCRQLSSWKGGVNHMPKLQAQRAHCNLVLLLYICVAATQGKQGIVAIIRVVATVGGAGRAAHHLRFPPGTKKIKMISARHNFFFFFFLVPGTMFHNWGSIIAQQWPCQALNPCQGIARGPPVVGSALRWLHSLRLPLLFTIISQIGSGYNPGHYWLGSLYSRDGGHFDFHMYH